MKMVDNQMLNLSAENQREVCCKSDNNMDKNVNHDICYYYQCTILYTISRKSIKKAMN